MLHHGLVRMWRGGSDNIIIIVLRLLNNPRGGGQLEILNL